jgi:hypothetical protein
MNAMATVTKDCALYIAKASRGEAAKEGDVIHSQLNIQFTSNAFRTITDDNVSHIAGSDLL